VNGSLRALLRLAPVPRVRFVLAACLGALTVAFGVGLMGTAGYLITRAAEHPPVLSLLVAIVAVRFFGLGRPIVRYLDRLRSHDVALRVLGSVRQRFYERIEPLAPAELGAYRRGDLLSRMVADVDALQNLYLRGIGPLVVALLAGLISVAVAGVILPAAGIVLAAGLLCGAVIVPAISGALSARAGRSQAEARGELAAELVDLLGGVPELVLFGGEGRALARMSQADRRLVDLARRNALATGVSDGLGLVVTGLAVGGVLATAVAAAQAGRLGFVLVATLALLALASFEAVTPLGEAARELFATRAAGRRLLELTARAPAVRDPARPAPAPRWPLAIALDDIEAVYPGQRRPALERFSLTIAPGEKVALLGPSGAGKTTVVNLLLRFLDPRQGSVRIAGRDARDYRPADVRRLISLAGQESHLFSASIRENLLVARPDASDAELEAVLRQARIWEWADGLSARLDTPVGECGRELSGGQRQRIVLARALLAGAPVLVLDEPTAHLDQATATELIRDVLSATEERSMLLITHRTEGLELVDRTVRLGRT
jgi:thiol reductant ABC exporter CydC subunit